MGKIYTKTGDRGDTALVGGQRVPKSDFHLRSYGTVDELNSFLGWTRLACGSGLPGTSSLSELDPLRSQLEKIQHWLFDLGSLLACLPGDRVTYQLKELSIDHVKVLEKAIDEFQGELPPLRQFILPGGTELAARLHICRTVVRRLERHLREPEQFQELPSHALEFVNRLSDYFFVAARWANHKAGCVDQTWDQSCDPKNP